MAIFQGAGVALLTPFHEDNSINYEELERIIEFQIAGHTDAIIVAGTTGEPATMTMQERLDLISFVITKVAHRVPVIAGTGANCTQEAIVVSKKVQELGADALLVVTPFYNKCTQNGLLAHYEAIAKEVELPIVMYNVPSRTGCNILPETAVRIAKEIPNVVAIKEACGNISQLAKLAKLSQGVLDIYSGNDDQILPILSLGGKGVISVLSNLVPQQTHDMVMSYLEGNTKKATELQLQYLGVANALFCEVNPIPVKYAAKLIGFQTGGMRLPLTELEEEHKILVREEMKKAGIIHE